MPCSRTISWTYNCASLSTSQVLWMAIKWANLVKSVHDHPVAFFFEAERDNPITKSIEIESYFQVGISQDLSSPTGRWCSSFTFWHVKHLSTYSAISLFIFSHQKNCLKSQYIFVPPRCTEYRVLWASSRILFFSSSLLGTHSLFWNLKVPSSCTKKPGDFPWATLHLILSSLASSFLACFNFFY